MIKSALIDDYTFRTIVWYVDRGSIICKEGKGMEKKIKDGKAAGALSPEQIENIQRLAEGIRYGTITLVFQDGELIQIDKNEKFRIDHKKK